MGSSKISLLAVLWFALLVGSRADEQESEQERRPIKTFKTVYGEIIDCINTYRQPAFDHPLLKDHKLQKGPSFSLDATKHRRRAQAKQPETSHVADGCPEGTIPILRTSKEDRRRAKFLAETRPQMEYPSPAGSLDSQFAYMDLLFLSGNPTFGAQAIINRYIPKCGKGQFSAAQIWMASRRDDAVDTVQTGWRVDPDLYNDDQSHFFIYWQTGENGAGCFDLRCPGFVQVDRRITLGQALLNSSTYGGQQFEIDVAIRQDPNTKNWWLTTGGIDLGYWPGALFPWLSFGAGLVQYGGATHTANGMPFPAMGSGHIPDGSYSHACCIRQIHYRNDSSPWLVPEPSRALARTYSKGCYRAALDNADARMGSSQLPNDIINFLLCLSYICQAFLSYAAS